MSSDSLESESLMVSSSFNFKGSPIYMYPSGGSLTSSSLKRDLILSSSNT
jgi:hypothetical protein